MVKAMSFKGWGYCVWRRPWPCGSPPATSVGCAPSPPFSSAPPCIRLSRAEPLAPGAHTLRPAGPVWPTASHAAPPVPTQHSGEAPELLPPGLMCSPRPAGQLLAPPAFPPRSQPQPFGPLASIPPDPPVSPFKPSCWFSFLCKCDLASGRCRSPGAAWGEVCAPRAPHPVQLGLQTSLGPGAQF